MTFSPKLHIDFETRSELDIKKVGAWNYSKHYSTSVLCMAYSFGEEVFIWAPDKMFPEQVIDHVRMGRDVVAHNAQFEYSIWNNCLFKNTPLKIEQMYCTMSYCFAMALPGSLENAAIVLKLKNQKNIEGHRIMLQLSQPRTKNPLKWWECDDQNETEKKRQIINDKFHKLREYCIDDVRVEQELDLKTMHLSDIERRVWILDQEINNRGIKVDVPLLKKAMQVANLEKERMSKEVREITNGVVSSFNAIFAMNKWIKDQGIESDSLNKTGIVDLLKQDIPYDVKKVLELRQLGGKSSTAKLEAMIDYADIKDFRVRQCFQYHAASTGRWGGRKIQPQNFPRPDISQDKIESVFNMLSIFEPEEMTQGLDLFYGNPLSILSNCLRGFIIAEKGYDLISVDFASIEARVLAWLAGEEPVLEIFRTTGLIYEKAASDIYKIPIEEVNKEQRFIGKIAVLALGYGGGKKAFAGMAKQYGVDINEDEADEIKHKWRASHPNIVNYWYTLERAAINAVKNPHVSFYVGEKNKKVMFKKIGKFLWCELPSKRILCYPFPKIENKMMPWGTEKEVLTYSTTNSTTNKWSGHTVYGGLLSENITQAVARDILANALLNLDANGYNTVMHVHDEIVCEVPEGSGSVEEVTNIMCTLPGWANGLPIAAEGYRSKRYRK